MAKHGINSEDEIEKRLVVVNGVITQLGYTVFSQQAEPIPTVIADHDASRRAVIIPLADGTVVSTYWPLTALGQGKPNAARNLINEINAQCTLITFVYPSEGKHVQIRAFNPGQPTSTAFMEFMQCWLRELSAASEKIDAEDPGFFAD